MSLFFVSLYIAATDRAPDPIAMVAPMPNICGPISLGLTNANAHTPTLARAPYKHFFESVHPVVSNSMAFDVSARSSFNRSLNFVISKERGGSLILLDSLFSIPCTALQKNIVNNRVFLYIKYPLSC